MNLFFNASFQLFYLFFIRLHQLTIVAGGLEGGRKTEPQLCFYHSQKSGFEKKKKRKKSQIIGRGARRGEKRYRWERAKGMEGSVQFPTTHTQKQPTPTSAEKREKGTQFVK